MKSSDVKWAYDLVVVSELSAQALKDELKKRWPALTNVPSWLVYGLAAVLVAEMAWAKREDEGCGVVIKSYFAPTGAPVPAVNINPQ